MSTLAKPGVYTPNSDAGAISAGVNLEFCKDISTADLPAYATSENNKPRFIIQFRMLGSDNQEKDVIWTYSKSATAEADRDTDYADVLAVFADSL